MNPIRGLLCMRYHPPAVVAFMLTLTFLLLAGCGQEDIRTYEVPKVAEAPKPATKGTGSSPTNPGTPVAGSQRLLAVIAPRGKEVWHLKLMGPSSLVNAHFEEFVKFSESVKFKPGKAEDGSDVLDASWTLPKGWTQKPASGMRYATIIIGEAAHGLELTVFRLGPESGAVLPNVQRWAGQVGVSGVTQGKLADMTKPIVIEDQPATLVDVTGPGASGDPSMAGPPRPQPPVAPGKPEKLVATAPQGWTEDPNPGDFLISKYDITKDGKSASLTVSSAGGDIEANLNRWRGQVGLEPWDETSIQKAFEGGGELKQAEMAGRRAIIIDIVGPESAGDKRERILGALTSNPNGSIWFIKFRGPAELVGSQQAAFDAFVKSIRFEN